MICVFDGSHCWEEEAGDGDGAGGGGGGSGGGGDDMWVPWNLKIGGKIIKMQVMDGTCQLFFLPRIVDHWEFNYWHIAF